MNFNPDRCPSCGMKKTSEKQCPLCGHVFGREIKVADSRQMSKPSPAQDTARPGPGPARDTHVAERQTSATQRYTDADLIGTLIRESDIIYEHSDFNYYRFFTILLLIMMALPVFLFFYVVRLFWLLLLRIFGFHPAVGGWRNLFFFIPGMSNRGNPDIPVKNFVIRTPQGQKRSVRIKGHLTRGILNEADRVALNGFYRDGVFIFQHGVNVTTGAQLRLRRNPWRTVFFTILILVCLSLLAVMFTARNFNLGL